MKRIALILWTLWLSLGSALAMSQSSIPPKFGLTWGADAASAYIRSIPQASQIGIQNCAASLHDGFPPLSFTPVGAGGCPPFGQDFNGILNQVTAWNQWQSAGGPVFYDSGFSTSIGGYPKGAVLQSSVLAGRLWYNMVDNNTVNPDSTAGTTTNWIVLPGLNNPGQPVPSLTTTIPQGQVSANGFTVGNATSNATGRANADTFWLFTFLWNNCASCTLFNSAGSIISKGANAAADFAANDAIATINMNGAGLIGADSQNGSTSSNLTGVPVTSGNSTTPGSLIGENLHSLLVAELAAHSHTITDPGHHHTVPASVGSISSGTGATFQPLLSSSGVITGTSTTGITGTNSTGSGTGHNTVELSTVVYWNLAL